MLCYRRFIFLNKPHIFRSIMNAVSLLYRKITNIDFVDHGITRTFHLRQRITLRTQFLLVDNGRSQRIRIGSNPVGINRFFPFPIDPHLIYIGGVFQIIQHSVTEYTFFITHHFICETNMLFFDLQLYPAGRRRP